MSAHSDVRSDLTRYTGVGLHFAATIGVFAGLGYWVDARWGTSPWLLLVGVFLGFGLGLTSLISKLGPRATTTPTGRASSRDPHAPHPDDDRSR